VAWPVAFAVGLVAWLVALRLASMAGRLVASVVSSSVVGALGSVGGVLLDLLQLFFVLDLPVAFFCFGCFLSYRSIVAVVA